MEDTTSNLTKNLVVNVTVEDNGSVDKANKDTSKLASSAEEAEYKYKQLQDQLKDTDKQLLQHGNLSRRVAREEVTSINNIKKAEMRRNKQFGKGARDWDKAFGGVEVKQASTGKKRGRPPKDKAEAAAIEEQNKAIQKNIALIEKENAAIEEGVDKRESDTYATSAALGDLTSSSLSAAKALDVFAAKLATADVDGGLGSSNNRTANRAETNLSRGIDNSKDVGDLVNELKKPVATREINGQKRDFWDPVDVKKNGNLFAESFFSKYTGREVTAGTQFLPHPSTLKWEDPKTGKTLKAPSYIQEAMALNYLNQFPGLTNDEKIMKLQDMGWDDYGPKVNREFFRFIEQSQVPLTDVKSDLFKEGTVRISRDAGGYFYADTNQGKNHKTYMQLDSYLDYLSDLDSLGLAGKDKWDVSDLDRVTSKIGNTDNLGRLMNDPRWQQGMYDTFLDPKSGGTRYDANDFIGRLLTSVPEGASIMTQLDHILGAVEVAGGNLKSSPGTFHSLEQSQDISKKILKENAELEARLKGDQAQQDALAYHKQLQGMERAARKPKGKKRNAAQQEAKELWDQTRQVAMQTNPELFTEQGRLKTDKQLGYTGAVEWKNRERFANTEIRKGMDADYKKKQAEFLELRDAVLLEDRFIENAFDNLSAAEHERLEGYWEKYGLNLVDRESEVARIRKEGLQRELDTTKASVDTQSQVVDTVKEQSNIVEDMVETQTEGSKELLDTEKEITNEVEKRADLNRNAGTFDVNAAMKRIKLKDDLDKATVAGDKNRIKTAQQELADFEKDMKVKNELEKANIKATADYKKQIDKENADWEAEVQRDKEARQKIDLKTMDDLNAARVAGEKQMAANRQREQREQLAWEKANRDPVDVSAERRANKMVGVNTALADLEMLTKQFQELTGEVYDSSRAFSSYNTVVDGTEKELQQVAYELRLVENELKDYNRVMTESSRDTSSFEYQLEKLEKQTKQNMSASKALITHYDNLAREFKELTGVTYVAGMSLDEYAKESKAATPAAAALQRELDATSKSMAKVGITTQAADKQLKQFDNTAKGIDKHLTPTGAGGSMFFALAAGLTMALAAARDLDEMITELTYHVSGGEAVVGWTQIVTGDAGDSLSTEEIDEYSRSLQFLANMSVLTTTRLTETVSAATELAKAGVEGATAMFVLAGSMMIADMEGLDLNETLSALIGSGRAMGLTFDADPNDKKAMLAEAQEWMDYFADILFAADATGSSVEDVLYGLRYLSPLGTTLGMDQDELIALSAILGNVGLEGGKGARTLASGLMRLASPTEEAAAFMEQLGIEIYDTNGQMNSMVEILDDLIAASEAMSDAQAGTAWNSIFGKEATKGFAGLMEQQEAFEELVTLLDAEDSGAYLMDRFTTTLWKGTNGYTTSEMLDDIDAAGMTEELFALKDALLAFENAVGMSIDFEYDLTESLRKNLADFQMAMFMMEDEFVKTRAAMYEEMGMSQKDAMNKAQDDWDEHYDALIAKTEGTVTELMDILGEGWWSEMGEANPEFVIQASALVGLEILSVLGTHLINDLGELLGNFMPKFLDWIDKVNARLEESGSNATFGEALTAYAEAFAAFKIGKGLANFISNHRLLLALMPTLIDQYGSIEEVMGAIKTHMDDIIKTYIAWQRLMLGADLLNLAVNTIAAVAALWEALAESDGLFGDNGLIEILKNFDGKSKKKEVDVDVTETHNTNIKEEKDVDVHYDDKNIKVEVEVEVEDSGLSLDLFDHNKNNGQKNGVVMLPGKGGNKNKNKHGQLLLPAPGGDNKKGDTGWLANMGLGGSSPAMTALREVWDHLGIITKSITRFFVPGWWNAVALVGTGLAWMVQAFGNGTQQIDSFIRSITPLGNQVYQALPEETQIATQTLITACSQIDGLLRQITPLQAVIYSALPEETQKAMLEIINAGDQIDAVYNQLPPFAKKIWKDMSPLTQAAIIELEGVMPVLDAIAKEFPNIGKLIEKHMDDEWSYSLTTLGKNLEELEAIKRYLDYTDFTLEYKVEVDKTEVPDGVNDPGYDADDDLGAIGDAYLPSVPSSPTIPPMPGLQTSFGMSAYQSRGLGARITNNTTNDNRIINVNYNVQGKDDGAFEQMVSQLRGL